MAKKKKPVSAVALRKREERKFSNEIVSIFKASGFTLINSKDKEFVFKTYTSEIDNIFLYENIIIISEDTIKQSSDIGDHLRKKESFYKIVNSNNPDFVQLMIDTYPDFKLIHEQKGLYSCSDYKIIFLYCSKNTIDTKLKDHFNNIIKFFDYQFIQYFLSITKVIYGSAKYEVFDFLGLNIKDIGNVNGSLQPSHKYNGIILPERPSGYENGYKIITFYVDPDNLIKLGYVFRKDGSWRDRYALYQRLLIKSKITKMREYLVTNERVYINNLIVTLPSKTKILEVGTDDTLSQEKIKEIKTAKEISIQIPYAFNQIGIIDGQHRLFSYHEGVDKFEKDIAIKRGKQHLLATGIIFPDGMDDDKKLEFESKLFLEINDKQSKVNSALKLDIQSLVHPFDAVSIAKAVVNRISTTGPLLGYLEAHYFDKGKTKTSSIVSYGLRHIVKLSGTDSLFSTWNNPNKEKLLEKENKVLLGEYIDYCTEEVNNIFTGYRAKTSKSYLFTLDKDTSRALFTTALNGVIFCLRILIENKTLYTKDEYIDKFDKLSIDFSPEKFKYKSSHWKDLGEEIYNQCFK